MLNDKEYNELTRLKGRGLNGDLTIKEALRFYELNNRASKVLNKKENDKNDTIKKTWSIYDKKEKSYE
jgi:hypothetical protein|tara:strand:+ start:132 stop:335 length:204 start_codon:yes stop_codon:yes gene_type:complete